MFELHAHCVCAAEQMKQRIHPVAGAELRKNPKSAQGFDPRTLTASANSGRPSIFPSGSGQHGAG